MLLINRSSWGYMKTTSRILLPALLATVIQAASVGFISDSCPVGRVLAVTSVDETNPGYQSANPNETDVVTQIGEQRERIVKLAIVIIFAVLFILSMYWLTYGRWHHRLPRY
jgi:hypothetical protein